MDKSAREPIIFRPQKRILSGRIMQNFFNIPLIRFANAHFHNWIMNVVRPRGLQEHPQHSVYVLSWLIRLKLSTSGGTKPKYPKKPAHKSGEVHGSFL